MQIVLRRETVYVEMRYILAITKEKKNDNDLFNFNNISTRSLTSFALKLCIAVFANPRVKHYIDEVYTDELLSKYYCNPIPQK